MIITINTLKHAGTMFSGRRDALNALLLDCIMSASSPVDDFPIDWAPFPFLCELIDANGREAAFQRSYHRPDDEFSRLDRAPRPFIGTAHVTLSSTNSGPLTWLGLP
jgi:hypothetical protein